MRPFDMLDISIILNAHRESIYLARTLESIAEAAAFARLKKITIELVLVFDNTDDLTMSVVTTLKKDAFDNVKIVKVSNSSLSSSRNDGVDAASGKYISIHDADDLISFNFFHACFTTATAAKKRIILYPEWVIGFGVRNFIAQYRDAERAMLSIVDTHPFVSCCFAVKDLFASNRYQKLDIHRGEAYEDWLFNANALAQGFIPTYCPDIILFYRQSQRSMMAQNRQSAIALETPHSPLFTPSIYTKTFGPHFMRLQTSTKPELKIESSKRTFLSRQRLKVLTSAINRVDASVELRVIHDAAEFDTNSTLNAGQAYLEICEKLGNRVFDEVFIMPYLIAGGGERYILDVMQALQQLHPEREILVITGEPVLNHVWLNRLPPGAVFVDLTNLSVSITPDQADRLVFRIIQSSAPCARIHMKTSMFAHRFYEKFHRHLFQNKAIYYRFCDDVYPELGSMVTVGWQTIFLSETLNSIDMLISDNSSTIRHDLRTFGVHSEKWKRLPALVSNTTSKTRSGRTPTYRMLWASRISSQKRPSLIPIIAAKLNKRDKSVSLEVYGTLEPGFDTDFGEAIYRGGFSKLEDINFDDYDALLYTSWFDGLPNIILEAMSQGLPVIAPNIGGISDAIKSQETGILVSTTSDDVETASSYCEAIDAVYSTPSMLEQLSCRGLEYVRVRHSQSAFTAQIKTIFQ